jgi:hypothetical protein
MAHNTGMSFFTKLNTVTYLELTYEFIANFEDTLISHSENCNV